MGLGGVGWGYLDVVGPWAVPCYHVWVVHLVYHFLRFSAFFCFLDAFDLVDVSLVSGLVALLALGVSLCSVLCLGLVFLAFLSFYYLRLFGVIFWVLSVSRRLLMECEAVGFIY